MKRSLSVIVISNIILHIYAPLVALGNEQKEEKTFIVTAYYSPLPNQSFYLRGNYEDEVILNGEGTHGASGKNVFPGMLAAPKNYPFGTKIELEGIGLGVVEDRGGAIVNAGKRGYEYDRIDVWMGYGEEGLKRALNWGKRKVKGVVYGKINKAASIDLSSLKSSNANFPTQKSPFNIFYAGIGKDSEKENIEALQNFLKDIEIYKGDVDGVYNTTLINNIYSFQKKYEIVSSPDEIGAGYWGIKTRKKIQSLYNAGTFKQKSTEKEKEFELFSTAISQQSPEEHIKELQQFFTSIEYYDGEISGEYKDIFDTIVDYQVEKNIIKSEKDSAAGYWGPKTREQAKNDYNAFLEKKRKEQEFVKMMEELKLKSLAKAETTIKTIGDVKKGDSSASVRELQKTLKKLGFFDTNDTAIFGDKTEEAILKYQISKNLVQKSSDLGAGKIGPKTKESIKNDLANILFEQEVAQRNKETDKTAS